MKVNRNIEILILFGLINIKVQSIDIMCTVKYLAKKRQVAAFLCCYQRPNEGGENTFLQKFRSFRIDAFLNSLSKNRMVTKPEAEGLGASDVRSRE